LEILIALGVLVMGVSAAVFLFTSSQSLIIDANLSQQAVSLSRQNLEIARQTGQQNFNALSSSSSTENGFLKELIVESVDADTKKITSRASWQTGLSKIQKRELITLLTDWRSVVALGASSGGSGGSPPSGNWGSPRTLASADLGPGNEGTDIEVKGQYAYLTSVASNVSKPDLFVFNVSDPASPQLVSQTDFGIKGFNNLNISRNYLYAVSPSDSQEFWIIDISNPAAPTAASYLNLSDSSDGLSVFYKNNFAYVGRKSGAPQEFVVIDVSNSFNPQYYSGATGVGTEINDIFVYNNRAYLGTEENSNSMTIIDVSNPASPALIGSLNLGEHVYGVYVKSESAVYVGGKTKFYIADATNPASVNVIGSIATGDKVQDVATAGNLAFLATANSNKEFQVMDISTSTSPTLYSYLNFPQSATGVDYLNNIIFLSVRSNDALRIITSQ